VAKAYASDAVVRAATTLIQVHGGIGFTWEHDAHLFYRRAFSDEQLFGDAAARKDLDSQGVLRQWEEGKRRETGGESLLGKSPAGLPALLQAYRVQEKAASVGFDWEDVRGVIAKLREELAEVEEAIDARREADVAEEVGDLLFAVVNLARFVKADPESRLRAAVAKFRRRFDRVMEMLRAEGRSPEEAGLPELDRLWEAVKAEERG
jgi:ATP diphosphatase